MYISFLLYNYFWKKMNGGELQVSFYKADLPYYTAFKMFNFQMAFSAIDRYVVV